MRQTLFLFLAAGCGQADVVDVWSGDCAITFDGEQVTYDLEIDIDSDEKGELGGTALFDVTGLGDLTEIPVDGTRKGKDVEIELVLDDETGLPISLEIAATAKGDEMMGDCVMRTFGIGVSGNLELGRGPLPEEVPSTKTVL